LKVESDGYFSSVTLQKNLELINTNLKKEIGLQKVFGRLARWFSSDITFDESTLTEY